MSTGAYLRMLRDGRWIQIQIEECTSLERRAFFRDRSQDELLRWIDVLCSAIVADQTERSR